MTNDQVGRVLIVLIPKVVYQVCSTVCITYLHTVGHVLIVLIPKVVYQVCSTVCITVGGHVMCYTENSIGGYPMHIEERLNGGPRI